MTLTIQGLVQGVGFRPFVYREALANGIRGWVKNTPQGVIIAAQGEHLVAFVNALRTHLPPNARIDSMEISLLEREVYTDFTIRESVVGEGGIAIPLDRALCPACEAEMDDSHNRRYAYPFINCTDCGPRYTILHTPPYDRVRTSMNTFAMCLACTTEYNDPTSRRYHAQPISCPDCGPQVRFLDNRGNGLAGDPLDHAIRMLQEGKIIALKGLGGFHLLCDATNDEAVRTLRERKHRKGKPLAVMFGSLEQLQDYVRITEVEKAHITGAIKPIVIVTAQKGTNLSDAIAPDLNRLGVFLPYTPLHRLLFEQIDFPLVATSANISNEPIIISSEVLCNTLGHLVEGILDHNRPIVNALDDAVIHIAHGQVVMMRMGRGFAPHTFALEKSITQPTLALGVHQKSAIALGDHTTMVLSGHIGDLGSIEADGYFERTIETVLRWYQYTPCLLVHDLHPLYSSTRYAHHQPCDHYGVQHHYAHILACMAEYSLEETVLGFAFDGTGYGADGTLWGGEVLIATLHGYERIGHLKPFALLGGENAIKEPRKIALALLFESYLLDEVLHLDSPTVRAFTPQEISTLHQMWHKKLNTPTTSSMGRLFDAVASLGGFIQTLAYEGQGGMMMEAFVEDAITEAFAFEVQEGSIDVSSMIREIIALKGDKKEIGSRFIATVVAMIAYFIHRYPHLPIVIGGGVFQNHALMRRLYRRFGEGRFYAQQQTPLNDGSIALGQLYYAIHNQKR